MWLIGSVTNVADNCPLGFQTLLNQQAFSLGFPKFDSLQSLLKAKSINLYQPCILKTNLSVSLS